MELEALVNGSLEDVLRHDSDGILALHTHALKVGAPFNVIKILADCYPETISHSFELCLSLYMTTNTRGFLRRARKSAIHLASDPETTTNLTK